MSSLRIISNLGQGFLSHFIHVLYVLCFSRPRYQVSVNRTIGPLFFLFLNKDLKKVPKDIQEIL